MTGRAVVVGRLRCCVGDPPAPPARVGLAVFGGRLVPRDGDGDPAVVGSDWAGGAVVVARLVPRVGVPPPVEPHAATSISDVATQRGVHPADESRPPPLSISARQIDMALALSSPCRQRYAMQRPTNSAEQPSVHGMGWVGGPLGVTGGLVGPDGLDAVGLLVRPGRCPIEDPITTAIIAIRKAFRTAP